MKKGNYANFILDLKCRLLDLEYTEYLITTDNQKTLSTSTTAEHNNHSNNPGELTIDPTEIIEPTKDYKPKYIDTLYPVAHFDRKLRSLSQLCHEPDMRSTSQHDQNGTQQQRRSLHNNTSVIPLVSIIEPKQRKHTKRAKRRLFDNATNHDMYTEAIKYMTDLTAELGRSSISLYLEEEDALHKEPVSQAITFGHVFMLNLEDPHLRQERLISENNEESNHYSPLFATAQLWESKQKRNYGNLLHILEKHQQYIHHVIYSLLTGRPVVIMGNAQAKSRIQQIVDALSIFVPGLSKSHHQILSWFTGEKLDDESLASIKLVGTTKDKIDPSIYRLDISCLEVDHQNGNGSLVTSPLYLDGQWVYEMLSKMSYYTSDESYIAYLHTRFMNMSLRAYIYHHKYLEQD
ncbi:uncharacterized protein BX664DRAFT_248310, partial [Halteromyces radiatus]|uniref:uncharacterized protein n=1 Tax=Halteromyces radiatus TaxID=101107 RepID=UPI0022206616